MEVNQKKLDRRCNNLEYNRELCNQLAILQKWQNKHKRVFPARALGRAISTITDWEKQHQRKIKLEDFFKPSNGEITLEKIEKGKGKFLIKGISKGIGKKLWQYIELGIIKDVEKAIQGLLEKKLIGQGKLKVQTQKDKAIQELMKISFVGKTKAVELYDLYKIKTGKDLTRNILKTQTDLLNLLTDNQKLMLKYHDQIQKRVPRDFIKMFEKSLHYLTNKIYGSPKKAGYKIVFAGSYRRGHTDSGDIDILVRHNRDFFTPKGKDTFSFESFIELLRKWGVIFETLTSGKTTFKGIGRCPGMPNFVFRIDLLLVKNPKEWIPALVAFTGNKDLNTRLRENAMKKNWLLNEKGLFHRKYNTKTKKYEAGKRVLKNGFNSEKELFKKLNVTYIPPTQRG